MHAACLNVSAKVVSGDDGDVGGVAVGKESLQFLSSLKLFGIMC